MNVLGSFYLYIHPVFVWSLTPETHGLYTMMKERLIATWPNSTCWVLKIECSFQVCWNCWWVVNWSWSKYDMTSRHTSFNVFLHSMILRTRKKNSYVWLWFRCWYVCQRALVSRHHGTVECFSNSVAFHSIDIFMPETNIDSTWTSMVGFGYFSWESAYFRGELCISRECIYKLFFAKNSSTIFTSLPTSTSISAHLKKNNRENVG